MVLVTIPEVREPRPPPMGREATSLICRVHSGSAVAGALRRETISGSQDCLRRCNIALRTVRWAYRSASFFSRRCARSTKLEYTVSGSSPASREPQTQPHSFSDSLEVEDSKARRLFEPDLALRCAFVWSARRLTEGSHRGLMNELSRTLTHSPCRFQFLNPGRRPRCSPEVDPRSAPIRCASQLWALRRASSPRALLEESQT